MTSPVLALRLALGTLTVVPVGRAGLTRSNAGALMLAAPAAGVLVGLTAGGTAWLVEWRVGHDGVAALLAASAAVTVAVALTRALHLDGLADTADGLGSLHAPAEAREVMRRGDTGPFGVTAVVLTLLMQAAALAVCVAGGRGALALVVAHATGRLAATVSCTPGNPAADPTGLGALVAGTVQRRGAVAATVATLLCAGAAGALQSGAALATRCGLAVVVGLVAAAGLRRHAVRRLGGLTGDVLGAVVETALAAALLTMAL
ncbi:MAG TPA: adenosylcobinamide-GDP ribazoletransferase [Mycobacteriales bacterium]|nr:adenosylcobinamide-GDP ribazoletransferase [Mycobacteriales bacterium]